MVVDLKRELSSPGIQCRLSAADFPRRQPRASEQGPHHEYWESPAGASEITVAGDGNTELTLRDGPLDYIPTRQAQLSRAASGPSVFEPASVFKSVAFSWSLLLMTASLYALKSAA